MKPAYTVRGLQRRRECLRLGDTVILPKPASSRAYRFALRQAEERKILERIFPGRTKPIVGTVSDALSMATITQKYLMEQESAGRDPRWFDELPQTLALAAKMDKACFGQEEIQYAVVPHVPYAGFGFIALEDGLVQETVETFGLFRLGQIRQLGFIHDPNFHDDERLMTLGSTFAHTRYLHVLNVHAMASLMTENCGLKGTERDTLLIAALTHDTLTPAGGDTTKIVDRKAFDEDEHYPELLAKTDWSVLRDKYGIRPDELIQTVQGKGLRGQLLDLCDKAGYLSFDAWYYVGRYKGSDAYCEGEEVDLHGQIEVLLRKHPLVCSLWEDVAIHEGKVVITNPEKLHAFLKLRMLMFHALYHNTGARFLEFIVGAVVLRYAYDTGKLTRDWLLEKTDSDLERFICDFLGIHEHFFSWSRSSFGEPSVEGFGSVEDAATRMRELYDGENSFCVMETLPPKLKPGTHYLVPDRTGLIRPFKEAYPDEAHELDQLAILQDPWRVYSVKNPRVDPGILGMLKAYHQDKQARLR